MFPPTAPQERLYPLSMDKKENKINDSAIEAVFFLFHPYSKSS